MKRGVRVRVTEPGQHSGDPLPRPRQLLDPVLALDLAEGERVAVHDLVDGQVDPETDADAGDRQPLDPQPPIGVDAPLQQRLDDQGRRQDQPVRPRERGQGGEEAGQPPSVRPRQPQRAEGERQEEALGVADVQEERGREDEQQSGRPEADAVAKVDLHEPIQDRGHEERGDGRRRRRQMRSDRRRPRSPQPPATGRAGRRRCTGRGRRERPAGSPARSGCRDRRPCSRRRRCRCSAARPIGATGRTAPAPLRSPPTAPRSRSPARPPS